MSSGVDRGHLLTEQANPASADLDLLSTSELVQLFCEEDLRPQQAVAGAAAELSAAIDAIAARLLAGGRLFYLGAGTSGRLGVLDAAECPPTFCSPPANRRAAIASMAALSWAAAPATACWGRRSSSQNSCTSSEVLSRSRSALAGLACSVSR